MAGFDLLGSLSGSAGRPGATSPEQAAGQAPEPQCSRKGCRAAAAFALHWNNPKVHAPDRIKLWLACDAHREWLADYLSRRGFLRSVTPFPIPPTTATPEG